MTIGSSSPLPGRGRDAAVLGVGVVALVLGEEDDVLADPDGPDAALLGTLGDDVEQLAGGHGARRRHPQVELHVSLPAPTDEAQISSAACAAGIGSGSPARTDSAP